MEGPWCYSAIGYFLFATPKETFKTVLSLLAIASMMASIPWYVCARKYLEHLMVGGNVVNLEHLLMNP